MHATWGEMMLIFLLWLHVQATCIISGSVSQNFTWWWVTSRVRRPTSCKRGFGGVPIMSSLHDVITSYNLFATPERLMSFIDILKVLSYCYSFVLAVVKLTPGRVKWAVQSYWTVSFQNDLHLIEEENSVQCFPSIRHKDFFLYSLVITRWSMSMLKPTDWCYTVLHF